MSSLNQNLVFQFTETQKYCWFGVLVCIPL